MTAPAGVNPWMVSNVVTLPTIRSITSHLELISAYRRSFGSIMNGLAAVNSRNDVEKQARSCDPCA
ncbi:hypothetical protein M404DRAFT_994790, partial [Pisolithus tinctorius Marx 270]